MKTAASLSGFISISPKLLQLHRSSCHYYADVFGVAYGFYCQEDRDAFVDHVPPACELDSHKVGVHGELSRYRFVVVCRSYDHAMQLYRQYIDALMYSRHYRKELQ